MLALHMTMGLIEDSKAVETKAEHIDNVDVDDVAHIAGVEPEQHDLKLNFATWMAFFVRRFHPLQDHC